MTTLESQKQQGFYVDVNMKKQTIGLPKRIRKRDYLRLRGVANGAFPLVGWMVKYGYTPEGKTHIMELVQFGRTDWTKRG